MNIIFIIFFLSLGFINYVSAKSNSSPDINIPEADLLPIDIIESNDTQEQLFFEANTPEHNTLELSFEKISPIFKSNSSPDINIPEADSLPRDIIESNDTQGQLLFETNIVERSIVGSILKGIRSTPNSNPSPEMYSPGNESFIN